MLNLASPLTEVKGVGPRRREILAEAGLMTVEDLLLTLPFRYEDRRRFLPISSLAPGDRATVSGRILKATLIRTSKRGFTLYQALVSDGSGQLPCVWFNQPYLRNVLKEGRSVILFGEAVVPARGRFPVHFRSPEFEVVGEDPERIHTGRIVPIYRRVGDLSPRELRRILFRLLQSLPALLPDPLPRDVGRRFPLLDRGSALRDVHFPPPESDFARLKERRSPAHRRLAFEELFFLQLAFARARRGRDSHLASPCPLTPEIERRINGLLPFQLTRAQCRVFGEIAADLASARPMSRLLQGEVGCGKTVVAFLAALTVIENGCQVALMAPTEILARQHFLTLRPLLAGRHRIELLTASIQGAHRSEVLGALSSGAAHLVVGTHSLIQEPVRFTKLGLVIVDEQHRFGVRQRARLAGKGTRPHLLLMTATPIPRSLALTLYGDLDISRIDETPPGRKPVRTLLRTPADRAKIYSFIREKVQGGGRALIVYPLVKGTEPGDLRSAISESERLTRGPFRGLSVGLLHGGLPTEEKSRVMEAFSAGRISILVATTLIEVGIDVPDASILLVESADRFGLSQLHQLRGRVGRGSEQSWCILLSQEQASPMGAARLRILVETRDGIEIAHKDLELRGPGEMVGERQSGDPGLRVASLIRDLDLLERARQEAFSFAANSPTARTTVPQRFRNREHFKNC